MPSFPTVTVLDSFKRPNENPLSDGGKWKSFFPAGSRMGSIQTERWETLSSGSVEGAYWQPIEFSAPGVALQWFATTAQSTYWRLWACVSNPTTSALNGYAFKLKQEGSGKFEAKLEKCVADSFTELAKTTGVGFAVGDRFGLSVQEGKVINWRKKSSGAWEELLSKTDGTYTTGFVAFDAIGQDGNIVNFEAGGAGGVTIENPGKQHSVLFKEVSLQIHALGATKYFATNLPTGLSISETTGLITGETEVEESTLVKIKVENEFSETAETSFEWDVTAKPNNVISMVLG